MKFRCSQQELTKALNTVSKAVSNRTTLPVLKGILINASSDDTILITASDLEISIKKEMKASVEEEGSVVVISKLFCDFSLFYYLSASALVSPFITMLGPKQRTRVALSYRACFLCNFTFVIVFFFVSLNALF